LGKGKSPLDGIPLGDLKEFICEDHSGKISGLITGFEGFLGSNLTRAMLKSGAKIAGLDIKTFRKETLLTEQDYRKMTVYKGSVADYALVSRILKKHSINVIFHLAAEAIVERSHDNPRRAFETNVAGTWEILEAARLQGGMDAVIVASSDKAYGSHKKLPYTENAPLQGRNLMTLRKAAPT
jgi:CDP-glucose 4,6-dehydratase